VTERQESLKESGEIMFRRTLRRILIAALWALALAPSPLRAQQPPTPGYALKANVRRVVVDVVATDVSGRPVRGLSAKDFAVEEDGQPQHILSFDAHDDKDAWTGTLPANIPPNTFINLPRQAEQGPLYVLLYDMLNSSDSNPVFADHATQIFARQQLITFIQSKPEGTRFAIMAISDGLHLIQGFTNERPRLFAALDPDGKTPHMPKVFLYPELYWPGDGGYYLGVMKDIVGYLDGFPGRKNLIWVSASFPFAVFSDNGPPDLVAEVRKELTAMAAAHIAVYPIDASGCCKIGEQNLMEDEVADETGGHAFYNSNDLVDSLAKAVDDGAVYYTLSYASTNKNYDGKLRHIEIKLARQGYRLAYRRQYYADPEAPVAPALDISTRKPTKAPATAPPPDTLYAYIRHGAPMSHDLLFSAHVQADGPPKLAMPEQMADLADEPAFFRKRRKERKNKPAAPPTPVPLQTYTIEYGIPSRQFRLQDATRDEEQDSVEFAAAAYDADGYQLNGNLGHATSSTREAGKYYRALQQFEVPTTAAWICLAVRDMATGRIGNVEFSLPLALEPAGGSASR